MPAPRAGVAILGHRDADKLVVPAFTLLGRIRVQAAALSAKLLYR